MATVTIDSGELPSAKGKKGYELERVLQRWGSIADGRFEYDCRALLQMIDEVDELRMWEYACEGFYKTRDEFLEKVVLIDFDLTEQSLTQIVGRLRGGEGFGLSRKDQAQKAREDAKQADLHKGGRGKKLNNNVIGFTNDSGNSQSALLRRLARRSPEILAQYEAGEFKSVHAAAIEAGIVKVKPPLGHLRSWWKKATPLERATFREEIKE